MSDAPLILGVSGLRGIVGESLTPEVAVRYAAAFGSWLREQVGDVPLVLICRDGRMGGGVMLESGTHAELSADVESAYSRFMRHQLIRQQPHASELALPA